VHVIFRHDYPLAVEPASTPRPLVQKKTLRDSVPIDMLLSAVSVLVVAQSSSEVPEGLMNNPVQFFIISRSFLLRMRTVSDKSCRENLNTHFVFNNVLSKIVPFMR